ncbi:SbcC/MukB-like Walker B domain-containing protein [Sinorhizobium meliloti]|uniref:SbcC/MukB-like Walker B domain-containing protein n=1 Tax=Rhizobium meliloti TaxID=382 RepID=UPI001E2E6340|nr:SbcC/MukB-like Walker B domain-containing protein [Sinorhizobium meliloti]UFX12729.1 hypothetical protein SmelRRI128_32545 [Sinorhizobium meliloti]
MSGGRYTLERERDLSKSAGKKGLGIVVHDVHTGRTRATCTLSGGETFMAALALALGLSDVVESVNGGVHLNTIFIDEGFGTLDTETLDQALQTLQDIVGESRPVGLISHVDIVQQAIPTGFRSASPQAGVTSINASLDRMRRLHFCRRHKATRSVRFLKRAAQFCGACANDHASPKS